MKAALVLSAVALLLVLIGNWMGRECAGRTGDRAMGWALAGTVAYLLATAFGLVALLRMLS